MIPGLLGSNATVAGRLLDEPLLGELVPGANHNDIFMRGLQEYLAAVGKLVDSTR